MKSLAISLLLLAACFAADAFAAEPTIDALLKNIPVLRCDDENITSFRCTMVSHMPFETELAVQFAWRNQDEFLVIGRVGEEQTPFCIVAQQKSLIYDASLNQALLNEGMRPKAVIGIADQKSVKLYWGLTSGKEAEVEIDLPSMFTQPLADGKLAKDKRGHWCLSTESASKNTRTVAVFEAAEGFPLRSVELRAADDDSVLLSIRDIALNQEDQRLWPTFPEMNQLPPGLKIEFRPMEEETKDLAPLQLMTYIVRAATSQVAIRNENWRQEKIFEGVDWEQAQKTNRDIGGKLARWCEMPGEIAGKESPETPIRR